MSSPAGSRAGVHANDGYQRLQAKGKHASHHRQASVVASRQHGKIKFVPSCHKVVRKGDVLGQVARVDMVLFRMRTSKAATRSFSAASSPPAARRSSATLASSSSRSWNAAGSVWGTNRTWSPADTWRAIS